jgi:hypothetical protein
VTLSCGTLASVSEVLPSEMDDGFYGPRHRRPESTRHRSGPWTRAWHLSVYAGAALAALVVALLLASAVHDSTQAHVAGTFTAKSCEGDGRHGCQSVGTWTSDDGQLTYRSVGLDGAVGTNGTSRSYAIPDAILGGTDTVHDSANSPLIGILVATTLLVVLALGVLRAAEKWGDLARLKNSWRRRKASRP